MSNQGEPCKGRMGQEEEELPQMDGSCDACEPDEAQPATLACYTCSFAFCPAHADMHARSTHHLLAPYEHNETHTQRPGGDRDSGADDGAEAGAGVGNIAARIQEMKEGVVAAGVWGEEDGVAGEKVGGVVQNGVPSEADCGAGAEGAEAGEEAVAAADPGRRDTVTVERLRCREHRQEGSLYCKPDEKVICVVCAVQGEHRGHEIITLHEAFLWQKVSLTLTREESHKESTNTRYTCPSFSLYHFFSCVI